MLTARFARWGAPVIASPPPPRHQPPRGPVGLVAGQQGHYPFPGSAHREDQEALTHENDPAPYRWPRAPRVIVDRSLRSLGRSGRRIAASASAPAIARSPRPGLRPARTRRLPSPLSAPGRARSADPSSEARRAQCRSDRRNRSGSHEIPFVLSEGERQRARRRRTAPSAPASGPSTSGLTPFGPRSGRTERVIELVRLEALSDQHWR